MTERVLDQTRPRRYCTFDQCPGQTPQIDCGHVCLIRWSTVQRVHQHCPHCHQPLDEKPPDGGVRELDGNPFGRRAA